LPLHKADSAYRSPTAYNDKATRNQNKGIEL
jgi:hypothetical protein